MVDDSSRRDILRRLDEIQRELWSLAPGEFATRYSLQRERDLLRDRVRVADDADGRRTTEDLESELAARRKTLAEIETQMVNTAGMSGGGGESVGSFEGPGDGLKLNTGIIHATGAQQLVHRIAKLETILDERRRPQDESGDAEPPSRP